MPTHSLNWFAGWVLILLGFLSGSLLGLFFHREEFFGGYTSFRRRIVRLGHIALVALGMLNVLYSISPWPPSAQWQARAASICLLGGGIAMPAVCFLTGWQERCRRLFVVPVVDIVRTPYATGRKVAQAVKENLNLHRDDFLPQLNYRIKPAA